MALHDPEARLRFSIDIVGPHSMDDAIGLQAEIRKAALAWVGRNVRLDEVGSHLHEPGCSFCAQSVADPALGTRTLDRT